jgi:carbamoyltransferase
VKFSPLCPICTEEDIQNIFKLDRPSPYMLLVVPVKSAHLKKMPENYHELPLFERLYFIRSDIPAVTHIDNSARIQSVNKSTNYRFWALINEFKRKRV